MLKKKKKKHQMKGVRCQCAGSVPVPQITSVVKVMVVQLDYEDG